MEASGQRKFSKVPIPFPFLFPPSIFLPALPTFFSQAVSGIPVLTFPVDIWPGQWDRVCVGVRGL